MTPYTKHCPGNLAATPIGLTDSLRHALANWVKDQRLKRAIRSERQRLLTLSDTQLRDIGIDRHTALIEAQRRDIPAERRG